MTDKKQKLMNYVSNLSSKILQHTPEWLEAKKIVIGGSTMASVLGMNVHTGKIKSLLSKYRQDNSNLEKMNWGNLLEDTIKLHIQDVYQTEVVADNSFIPLDVGPCAGCIAYSPDGLCVIKNSILQEKLGKCYTDLNSLDKDGESIILLEFKAPYSRRVDIKKIPEYYIPQPLTGMDCIGPVSEDKSKIVRLCDFSLFIECTFRFCDYSQLDRGRLHQNYPAIHPESEERGSVHCSGMILIYGPERGPIYDEMIQKCGEADVANELLNLSKKTRDDIIIAVHRKKLVSLHTGPCKDKKEILARRREILNDPSKSRSGHDHNITGLVPYGMFSWKLMECCVRPMFPEDNYIEKHSEEIVKYVNARKEINNMNHEDAIDYLCDLYNEDPMKYF